MENDTNFNNPCKDINMPWLTGYSYDPLDYDCGSSMCRNGCVSLLNFNEPCAHSCTPSHKRRLLCPWVTNIININTETDYDSQLLAEMRELCKPGFYSAEELTEIEAKGADLIRKWVDRRILENLLNNNDLLNNNTPNNTLEENSMINEANTIEVVSDEITRNYMEETVIRYEDLPECITSPVTGKELYKNHEYRDNLTVHTKIGTLYGVYVMEYSRYGNPFDKVFIYYK